jgi:hypothetical protein
MEGTSGWCYVVYGYLNMNGNKNYQNKVQWKTVKIETKRKQEVVNNTEKFIVTVDVPKNILLRTNGNVPANYWMLPLAIKIQSCLGK